MRQVEVEGCNPALAACQKNLRLNPDPDYGSSELCQGCRGRAQTGNLHRRRIVGTPWGCRSQDAAGYALECTRGSSMLHVAIHRNSCLCSAPQPPSLPRPTELLSRARPPPSLSPLSLSCSCRRSHTRLCPDSILELHRTRLHHPVPAPLTCCQHHRSTNPISAASTPHDRPPTGTNDHPTTRTPAHTRSHYHPFPHRHHHSDRPRHGKLSRLHRCRRRGRKSGGHDRATEEGPVCVHAGGRRLEEVQPHLDLRLFPDRVHECRVILSVFHLVRVNMSQYSAGRGTLHGATCMPQLGAWHEGSAAVVQAARCDWSHGRTAPNIATFRDRYSDAPGVVSRPETSRSSVSRSRATLTPCRTGRTTS